LTKTVVRGDAVTTVTTTALIPLAVSLFEENDWRLTSLFILGASMWEPESTSKVSGPYGSTRRNLEVGVWVDGGLVLAEREAFDADEPPTGVIFRCPNRRHMWRERLLLSREEYRLVFNYGGMEIANS
jgi:hypothetical protein